MGKDPFAGKLDTLPGIMNSVPEGRPQGWKVIIDGKETVVKHLRIVNPKIGVVEYGYNPLGWDQVFLRPQWGAATVVYAFIDGKLYVALVQENRFNFPNGIVLDMPGGFADPEDKTLQETAARELQEETGVEIPLSPTKLPGEPMNCNRAFFYSREEGNGDALFAMEISKNVLKKDALIDGHRTYVLNKQKPAKNEALEEDGKKMDKRHAMAKSMDKTIFFPWEYVAQKSDVFCRAGVIGLFLQLMKENRLELTFKF